MRLAARAVRASNDALTSAATTTTAITTPFVSEAAPRSPRHRRGGWYWCLTNGPAPLVKAPVFGRRSATPLVKAPVFGRRSTTPSAIVLPGRGEVSHPKGG